MKLLPAPWPFALIVVAVCVFALPWDETPLYGLVPPMLVYAVIHRCVERWTDGTPDWLVFLAGLATDIVGLGPLGYWALIYLAGYAITRSVAVERAHGFLPSVLLFAMTIAGLSVMQWLLTSIYTVRSAEIAPIAVGAASALCAYIALRVLVPAREPDYARLNRRLERGR